MFLDEDENSLEIELIKIDEQLNMKKPDFSKLETAPSSVKSELYRRNVQAKKNLIYEVVKETVGDNEDNLDEWMEGQ
jgi:hypothetical protein